VSKNADEPCNLFRGSKFSLGWPADESVKALEERVFEMKDELKWRLRREGKKKSKQSKESADDVRSRRKNLRKEGIGKGRKKNRRQKRLGAMG
jgi:hypothetical protein